MPYKGILVSQSTYMRAKQLENILKNDKSQNIDDSYNNSHNDLPFHQNKSKDYLNASINLTKINTNSEINCLDVNLVSSYNKRLKKLPKIEDNNISKNQD